MAFILAALVWGIFYLAEFYVAGCVYMSRGGSGHDYKQVDGKYVLDINANPILAHPWVIFNPMKWLAAHGYFYVRPSLFAAIFLTPLYFTPWAIMKGFPAEVVAWLTLGHCVGFLLATLTGWGDYFDIGFSNTERNQNKIIDWILLHTWGAKGPDRSPAWKFGRDYTGMFLRFLQFIAIFFGVAVPLYIYGYAEAGNLIKATLIFTFIWALTMPMAYACFSWFTWIPQGDDKPNWAEFRIGASLAVFVFAFVEAAIAWPKLVELFS